MFDDGRRVVGFRVNVERVVIWFSIWIILCGGKVQCYIKVVHDLEVGLCCYLQA